MLLRMAFFALFFFAATLLQAAPAAVVEGVQLPAWYTRDGQRRPLATATELRSSDNIATGVNSRVLLRIGDGSMVKLGENGQLQLSELVQRRQQNFLGATLKVLAGAFRFTTAAVQRTRASSRPSPPASAAPTSGARTWATRRCWCLSKARSPLPAPAMPRSK